ncbi:hypothetical protein [Algihabitans albus]|uniref:hypothetical protein n=1 Tax=Algihabitans albus TaxID=2164067 RepID=UPI000E5CD4D7|nr:hypothetical protein [Algihabitans albus]
MGATDVATWNFFELAIFAGAVAATVAASVSVGGHLPLAADRRASGQPDLILLLAFASAMLLLASIATVGFALDRLPLAGAIITGGFGLLAGPLLFQASPASLRDGAGGLLFGGLVCAGTALLLLSF